MPSRKTDSKPKVKATPVKVTEKPVVREPMSLAVSTGAKPRPCGAPEAQKTEDIGQKGEGGEFIKRGGKLHRS